MDLATSEMKVRNEIPVPEPARILVNETLLQGVAQNNLIGYSEFPMCFVSTLNVKYESSKSSGTAGKQVRFGVMRLSVSND